MRGPLLAWISPVDLERAFWLLLALLLNLEDLVGRDRLFSVEQALLNVGTGTFRRLAASWRSHMPHTRKLGQLIGRLLSHVLLFAVVIALCVSLMRAIPDGLYWVPLNVVGLLVALLAIGGALGGWYDANLRQLGLWTSAAPAYPWEARFLVRASAWLQQMMRR